MSGRRSWLSRLLPQSRDGWILLATHLLALGMVAFAVQRTLDPVLSDWSTWGSHDWDQITAYRYVMLKSFREYGQFPLWNPFTCGGHSAWAGVQEVSNLISPFMPAYWLLELRHALRVELLGTVLIGVAGTWLMASPYTQSPALRGIAAICFSLNGRWAMQAATGHDWHWWYALTPWSFYLFDRALRTDDRSVRFNSIVLSGVVIALMVYTCAIYPLPHTLTLLGLYALARAAYERSFKPIWVMTALTLTGVGLAAPKLMPSLELMSRFPRLVDSPEITELRTLVAALIAWDQTPRHPAAPVPEWGWHEYGIYIGAVPFLGFLVLSPLNLKGPVRALRWAALAGLVLGLGAFHEYAPWTLVHKLPLYKSQHVPSRWLHPAVLLFAVVAAASAERFLAGKKRRYIELGLLGVLGFVALDVSHESSASLEGAFNMIMRPLTTAPEYFQVKIVPPELQYNHRDYAPESMPAMLTNRGVIDCTMMPAQNVWGPRNELGRIVGIGARGRDEADYRGEIFTNSGVGTAHFTFWSMNVMEVAYAGAKPGDLLVLNQNWDPGWSVNGVPSYNERDRVAYTMPAAQGRARFVFWPIGLTTGIIGFALTLLVLLLARIFPALRARLRRRV
jgi:hypothetical protein